MHYHYLFQMFYSHVNYLFQCYMAITTTGFYFNGQGYSPSLLFISVLSIRTIFQCYQHTSIATIYFKCLMHIHCKYLICMVCYTL